MKHDPNLIDYLENEMSVVERNEFKKNLSESTELTTSLEALIGLKEQLHLDRLREPDLGDDFFDKMHQKIMDSVDQKQVVSAHAIKKQRLMSSVKRSSVWLAGSLPLLVSGALMASQYVAFKKNESEKQMIIELALHEPNGLAGLVTHPSESEFLMDVAQRNFDHLSTDDVQKIWDNM